MNTKQFIIFLILILHAVAQDIVPLRGYVFHEKDHEPLAGVEIWIEETGRSAITDDEGYFQFLRLKPGFYHLHFYRLGFRPLQKEIRVLTESTTMINISLKPDILVLDTVQVIAAPENFKISAEGSQFVLYLDSLKIHGNSILQIMEQIPGVTLLKNDKGTIRVLMKGTLSDFVKVMIDGVNISNPQTGEVDLSIIPEQQIERIEIYQSGNASFFGSQAMGGVINFITKKSSNSELSSGNSCGSFRFFKSQGALSKNFSHKRNIRLAFAYSEAENEYSYQYDGQDYRRKNNSYVDRNFSVKTNQLLNPFGWNFIETGMFVNYLHRNHQLPGTFYHFNQPRYARSIEDYWLSSMKMKIKFSKAISMSHNLSWKKYTGEFDGHTERYFRFWTVNQNDRLEYNTILSTQLFKGISTKHGFEWLEEKIEVEDRLNPFVSILPKERILRSAYNSMTLSRKIFNVETFWSASVRHQEYEKRWKAYPFFQGMLLWGHPWFTIQIGASYAENFKFPDLNSLFWVSSALALGNPELLPEEGINRQTELHMKFKKLPLEFYITRFSNDIFNYIYWEPDFRGIWKPKNLGRSNISGYSIHIRTHWQKKIEGIYDYYSQKPLNLTPGANTYEKIIPYLFLYQHKAQLGVHLKHFDWTIFTRWNSQRESLMANSSDTQMPAFSVTDVRIQGKLNLKNWRLGLVLEVNNLFEENYDLILGYPMPGRHYILTFWFKK